MSTTRFLSRCLALAATAVVLSSCGTPVREPMQVTILHTNDIHGKFRDTPATWRDGHPPIGGFANLSAYVNEERATAERVLLLDAGDLMTGNPICLYDYEGVKGGAMIAFMNWMGYDAMALGNHEFDHGLDTLYGLLSLAEFPILSANTFRPDGGPTAPKGHVILELNGLRVGIIGLLTENLYGVAAPSALAGTRVEPMAEIANKIIEKIDSKTDLIVLLTHNGVDEDRALAQQVEGVDIIVGGHSHTRLEEGLVENGVLIVQAGAHNRNMGRVQLTVTADTLSAYSAELIDLWPRPGGDQKIIEQVALYSERIERDYGVTIGHLATAWKRSRNGESNVGNWLAEQFRVHAGADFGLMNTGGIRKNMPAGPITKLDVLEIMPFANVLMTFKCTGEQLMTLVRTNCEKLAGNGRGLLQVSGIRFSYLQRENGEVEVFDLSVGGQRVDSSAIYTGVSNNYVVQGNAKRYFGFEPTQKEILGSIDADVIIEAIQNSPGPIDARTDGRMLRLPQSRAAGE